MNLKSLIKIALYLSGYYRFRYILKTARNKKLLILMYHDLIEGGTNSVKNLNDQGKLSRDEFDDHLRAIKNCCRCLTVEEAVGEINSEGGLRENTVSITFDDGYVSVYDMAFPLLKKYGVGATIYMPTDWIDGKLSLWWEDFNDMILGFQPDSRIDAGLIKIGDKLNIESSRYLANGRISKELLLPIFSHELMKSSDERKKIILEDLRDLLYGGKSYKRTEVRPITWEQAREMADAGNMFGAHTCSHVNLSYVDIEIARDEIARSKNVIENRLGSRIIGFAYPYGYDVDGYKRFIPTIKELGFEYACTSWWGNNTNDTDIFRLFRNNIPPQDSRILLKREIYKNLSD